jgi:precorrin-6x reductase
MNTCWKCTQEIPAGQTECAACAEGELPMPDDQEADRLEREFVQNWLELDWTKVQTLQDLIAILAKHGQPIFIEKGSAEHRELQQFLKPIE